MVTGSYQIGDAKLLIEAPKNLSGPENLKLFRMENGNLTQSLDAYDCHYILHLENEFASLIQTLLERKTGPVFKREDLTIFQTETGECRLMNFKGADWYYAASLQIEGPIKQAQIFALVTSVNRKGKWIGPGDFWWEFFEHLWRKIIRLGKRWRQCQSMSATIQKHIWMGRKFT